MLKKFIRFYLAKIGILLLIRQSYIWKLKNKKKTIKDNNEVYNLFFFINELLLKNNLKIWPTFGTLLGIIRDNKFIDYDFDIDFGMFYDQDARILLKKILTENGFYLSTSFKIVNENEILAEKFFYKDSIISIDIYYFFKKNKQFLFYDLESDSGLSVEEEDDLNMKIYPFENYIKLFQLEKYVFKNNEILVPTNVKNYLRELYGEKFMIPNSKWRQKYRKNRNINRSKEVIFEYRKNKKL
tara:strand:- start:68 stop:790 length:723 start_codon:yes stop_codon:yes gene_type:complete